MEQVAAGSPRDRNLRVTLDLDEDVTWAELFRFVLLARQAGVNPDDRVGLDQEEGSTTLGLHFVWQSLKDVDHES